MYRCRVRRDPFLPGTAIGFSGIRYTIQPQKDRHVRMMRNNILQHARRVQALDPILFFSRVQGAKPTRRHPPHRRNAQPGIAPPNPLPPSNDNPTPSRAGHTPPHTRTLLARTPTPQPASPSHNPSHPPIQPARQASPSDARTTLRRPNPNNIASTHPAGNQPLLFNSSSPPPHLLTSAGPVTRLLHPSVHRTASRRTDQWWRHSMPPISASSRPVGVMSMNWCREDCSVAAPKRRIRVINLAAGSPLAKTGQLRQFTDRIRPAREVIHRLLRGQLWSVNDTP